jgi:hypothetical protein
LERGAQISVTVIFSGGGKIAEAPDKLRDTIEQVAEKDDNVLKLRNSGRNKHHLFIWIDRRTDVDNQFTLTDIGCNVLSIAPQLPAEIDVLWVATDDWNGGFFVWRLEPPSPWQAFACRLEDLSMS